MNKENELTPQESLKIIEQSIAQTKKKFSENRQYYLLWGWAVVLTSLLHYALIHYFKDFAYSYLLWPLVMSICFLYTLFLGRKKRMKSTYKTYHESFLSKMWLTLGCTIFLLVFGIFPFTVAFIYLLTGCGTFISGLVLKEKWLIFGGIILYIACGLILHTSISPLLLTAIAYAVGYLLPAYLIKKR